jgi:hypothetical protein
MRKQCDRVEAQINQCRDRQFRIQERLEILEKRLAEANDREAGANLDAIASAFEPGARVHARRRSASSQRRHAPAGRRRHRAAGGEGGVIRLPRINGYELRNGIETIRK